jgi:hypothetical protein
MIFYKITAAKNGHLVMLKTNECELRTVKRQNLAEQLIWYFNKNCKELLEA